MTEQALAILHGFVSAHRTRAAAPKDFPHRALYELGLTRGLPRGSADVILSVLRVRLQSEPSNEYCGEDLGRVGSVAHALSACFLDVAVAAPFLVSWLSRSGPVPLPVPSGSTDRWDRDRDHVIAVENLALGCLLSLERLAAPPNKAYQSALYGLNRYENPEIREEVTYARARLRAANLREPRERVGGTLAGLIDRLSRCEGPAAAVQASANLLTQLVAVAEAAEVLAPEVAGHVEGSHEALVDSVFADLRALAPKRMAAVPETIGAKLRAALDGDPDAAQALASFAEALTAASETFEG